MSSWWAGLIEPINIEQRAGSNILRQLDVGALIVPAWQANMAVAAGATFRPTRKNSTGFWYQGAASGQTADSEPGWGTILAGLTEDGSVSWTAIAPPGSGQDSIASAEYTQVNPPDSALTVTPGTNSQRVAQVSFGGGNAGSVYTIDAAITMASGQVYVPQFILTIIQ
jgi:hypothetical protein